MTEIATHVPALWLQPPNAPAGEVDVDAYLARIGYHGGLAPTPETLRALAVHHAAAIPFENLDPLLGVPVRLDIASLQEKLVHGGRGGYCFEHNLLLAHVLDALGMPVRGLAARILWNAPADARPPRGHMLLRVELDEPWIVDVGFGGLTLTGALRLEPEAEQSTAHEPFRLLRDGDDWTMQAHAGGAWKTLYRFDLRPQYLADYEVTSWYLSNHPRSHFVTGLIAARAAPGRRYALRGAELAVHHLAGGTARRHLDSTAAIRKTLQTDFLLTLPEGAALETALERLVDGAERM
jgi:N-hydroxyarylamine O-acetyltransferase